MSGPVDVVTPEHWCEQAELAVAYAMSRPPGDSKGWEEAMRDATEFRHRAAIAKATGEQA